MILNYYTPYHTRRYHTWYYTQHYTKVARQKSFLGQAFQHGLFESNAIRIQQISLFLIAKLE